MDGLNHNQLAAVERGGSEHMAVRAGRIRGRDDGSRVRSYRAAHGASATATAPATVALLIATLLLPIYFEIGGQRLSPYRLFLLLTFVPFGIQWMSGRAGGITRGDILIGLFSLSWVYDLQSFYLSTISD
jgi:hypothetical protein